MVWIITLEGNKPA